MLLDPGPLSLIVDADFPTPAPRANFTGLAARAVSELTIADGQLAGAGSTFAGASRSSLEDGAHLELGAAAAELDRQARGSDPSIGSVAGSASTLEGEIAGLTGEITNDLFTPLPIAPDLPRGDEMPPDYPGDQWSAWDTFTLGAYVQILGRPASRDEMVAARGFFPDVERLRAYLRLRASSGDSGGGSPAPSPPAGDAFADQVTALYRELLGRDPEPGAIDAHRGNPNGIAGVRAVILSSAEYHARQGG